MKEKKGEISVEGFESFFDLMQQSFTCLRSGECCSNFGIGAVPGYNGRGEWTGNLGEAGYKPERQACHHLEPAKVVGGRWQPAACKIHDSDIYPDECRQFTFGIGPCALGRAIWKHRKEQYPEAELPDKGVAAV